SIKKAIPKTIVSLAKIAVKTFRKAECPSERKVVTAQASAAPLITNTIGPGALRPAKKAATAKSPTAIESNLIWNHPAGSRKLIQRRLAKAKSLAFAHLRESPTTMRARRVLCNEPSPAACDFATGQR